MSVLTKFKNNMKEYRWFIKPREKASEILDFTEEAFNKMSFFVKVFIIRTGCFSMWILRNNSRHVFFFKRMNRSALTRLFLLKALYLRDLQRFSEKRLTSWYCPGVSMNLKRFPRASMNAGTFVVKPPTLCPKASYFWISFFVSTRACMRPDNRCIKHWFLPYLHQYETAGMRSQTLESLHFLKRRCPPRLSTNPWK